MALAHYHASSAPSLLGCKVRVEDFGLAESPQTGPTVDNAGLHSPIRVYAMLPLDTVSPGHFRQAERGVRGFTLPLRVPGGSRTQHGHALSSLQVNSESVFKAGSAKWFKSALQVLAASGVHGVAVDVWVSAGRQQLASGTGIVR